MSDFFSQLIGESQAYSILEIIAVLSAVAYVLLAAKGNRICFIFGFISSAIYILITLQLKYYFDSLINLYYVAMSIYGWVLWKGTEKTALPISKLSIRNFCYWLIGGIILSITIGFIAHKYTDAALPYWDALTTVFSFIATWMVVKKYLRNWLIWIGVDTIAMVMYFEKGLALTSLLYLFYTIIAARAFFIWKKEYEQAT